MTAIGKRITEILESEYGNELMIVLDDGTALHVQEHGYDEATLEYSDATAEEVETHRFDLHEALEHRRILDEKHEARQAEWDALTPEEQERRTAERRVKMGPFARAVEDAMKSMVMSTLLDYSRDVFNSGQFTIPIQKRKGRARRS